MDDGKEAYIKLGTVTGHFRSPNRLTGALTRAMHGLVVVCQETLLIGNPKSASRGKYYSAMKNMCVDARERHCHISDGKTEDSHPISVEMRSRWKEKDLETERQEQVERDFHFFQVFRERSRNMKAQKPADIPHFRTAKGHTTRPFAQDSAAVITADKHDKERARLAKEAEEKGLAKGERVPALTSASKGHNEGGSDDATVSGHEDRPIAGKVDYTFEDDDQIMMDN